MAPNYHEYRTAELLEIADRAHDPDCLEVLESADHRNFIAALGDRLKAALRWMEVEREARKEIAAEMEELARRLSGGPDTGEDWRPQDLAAELEQDPDDKLEFIKYEVKFGEYSYSRYEYKTGQRVRLRHPDRGEPEEAEIEAFYPARARLYLRADSGETFFKSVHDVIEMEEQTND